MGKKDTKMTQRTSKGLRDILFDEIDLLRSGESTPHRAHAVAKLASGIVETVSLEMEVHKTLKQISPGSHDAIDALKPIALGHK